MPVVPPPEPTPEDPPEGSTGIDAVYPISNESLALLANDTKSSLLSVSNIGSAISSRINSTLNLVDTFGNFESYLLDGTVLDSLAHTSNSTTLAVTNVGSSAFVKIVIILKEITPSGTPKVCISDATTTYELSMPLTTSEKRLEFNNIPSGFVSSFYVKNNTGTSLASYGNSIVVIPL